MASPRIFISSTCYDLKYIRENLKFFIKNLGYEPVLSNEGGVFYNPKLHVQDACLAEVPTCQLFVLIIGGRSGTNFKESNKSITNHEFLEAVKSKVPVFALVEQSVHDQYYLYLANSGNKDIDSNKIHYPSVDSIKIFDFISSVQSQVINNALFPFSDFEGMQSYLRQQWASMFHSYLVNQQQTQSVTDVLRELSKTNTQIEYLSRQIIQSLGDNVVQAKIKAYDLLIESPLTSYLATWGIKVTPQVILAHKTLDEICHDQFQIDKGEGFSYTHGGPPYRGTKQLIQKVRELYVETREKLCKLIENEGLKKEDIIK